MNVRICSSTEEANAIAAWAFFRRAIAPDHGLIGIATGDTTKAIYRLVADVYQVAPFETSGLQISAVDDYCGIEKGHIASCATRVRAQLQFPLHLRDSQIHLPERFSGEPQEVALLYEEHLRSLGGIQTQFLGIGSDGHLGFCRPGTSFYSLAHAVLLPEDTRNMLASKYDLERERLPRYGVTLGLMSIMRIPEVIVIATGVQKAEAVRASLCDAPDEKTPASVLQLHAHVTWILDPAAASLL